jgi:hypothetical protein
VAFDPFIAFTAFVPFVAFIQFEPFTAFITNHFALGLVEGSILVRSFKAFILAFITSFVLALVTSFVAFILA